MRRKLLSCDAVTRRWLIAALFFHRESFGAFKYSACDSIVARASDSIEENRCDSQALMSLIAFSYFIAGLEVTITPWMKFTYRYFTPPLLRRISQDDRDGSSAHRPFKAVKKHLYGILK